ncbi:mechanosensitive ion channel family protein [Sandaracinobacter neustonicus]|nr:mechanosensitive ion channel domain-containing protein [Sandaracinobacter neustonicus]
MSMLDPLAEAPAKAATGPQLAEKANGDLKSLPDQVEGLTIELFHWLRTDSLGLLAGVAVGLVLYGLFWGVRHIARRRLRHVETGSFTWVLLKVAARTRSFFMAMAAAQIVSNLFATPERWTALISFLFTVAAAVQGAFWVREFLLSMVERKAASRADDANLASAMGVVTVIINVVVWAFAGIILLDNLGVNVTALVAGLGIGGIAIGLAAQGIFSDLFAALSILLDQPFRRGDTIQVGGPQGVVGTVEHIGMKTTRLRAVSGEAVVMSNANLLNQQINNFADFSHRRVVLLIEVIYQTDPKLLEQIPAELERMVNAIPDCRFDRAHLIQFATSALDYELVFMVERPDLKSMFDARQAVMIAMVRRFAELGIAFAFPSQTSYLAGPDGHIFDPHPPMGGSAKQPIRARKAAATD